MKERPSLFQSLVYGVLTAYGTALLFLFLIWLRESAAEEASRMGFAGSVLDPFVLTVLVPVGLAVGLAAGGLTHFAVSGRRYGNAVFTVVSSVLAWTTVATLASPGVALAGLPVIFGLALLAVRFVPWARGNA